MDQLQLEGQQEYVEPTNYNQRISDLREEFETFQQQMREAVARLLGQINTIRQGLHMAAGDEITTVPIGGAPQFDPKWTAWMEKFGRDKCVSRVIQAILDHGPLSRSQLRQATKSGWSTLDEATSRLKNLQLIEKSGDRWNLKS